jgi:3-oxoacyl-[acyl-carrier protein] reductase
MVRPRSGVLLALGGDDDPMRDHRLGGLPVAFAAIESMRRQASAEVRRTGCAP